jgi:glycosyltransferase involved in cell wall biosynthesis
MMKILYIIGIFYPCEIGGPSNAISWLVKYVHRSGVDTTVIATNYRINPKHNIKPDHWLKNEFGNVYYASLWSLHFPFRYFFLSMKEIVKTDIVHLNSIFHAPNILLGTWARVLGKKIMWDPGGEFAKDALKYGRLKKLIYLKLLRVLIGQTPVYHTTSDQETEDLKSYLGQKSKIFQAPNYIDKIEKLSCEIKPQLLFIGRIHPIKAIENLISALDLSKKFRPSEYQLIIAGDHNNEYGRELIQLVQTLGLEKKVNFIGHIEAQEKMALYASSYFMLLPSHSENFANVVTESLSQGTPVIASTGTPWAILQTTGAGFHVDNTPEALANALDRALSMTPDEYRICRSSALDLLNKEFSMESGVEQWLEIYRRILL